MRRLATIALLLLLSVATLSAGKPRSELKDAKRKIGRVLDYIDRHYIDEVPLDTLAEAALVAMFERLDPHSRYLSREDMRSMRSMLRAHYAGVGIGYMNYRETLVISRVMQGSPAERAGLHKGDRLLSVDGCALSIEGRDSIATLLRGARGTRVTLAILRPFEHRTFDVTLTRDNIASPTLASAVMLGDSTAYVHLTNFSRMSAVELGKALGAYAEAMHSLIIDLRGNNGGEFNAVLDIASMFLDKDRVIVSTESRGGRIEEYKTFSRGDYYDLNIAILIDEISASASELLTGALQDHGRATVVGRRSYGKGLVQRLIALDDGSGIAVTRARYKTPSGRNIQRPYRGHELYGEGGILPDIWVEEEQVDSTSYLGRALARGVVDEVIVELFDRRGYPAFVEEYPTSELYISNFELDSQSVEIISRCMYDTPSTPEERAKLQAFIRARLGRELYGEGTVIPIYNIDYDATLRRAIDVLRSADN